MWYCVIALAGSLMLTQAAQHPTTPGAHQHPDAAKQKNPVAADAASIAAGKTVYEKNCSNCHGQTGVDDGKMGAELNPKPSNLSDADWKHGASDGEIFAVIKEGVKGTAMKSYNSKLTPRQMWDTINYVRSLGPAKSH
ncbi:MAG TPA: cytochrome c [Steroidobacteraceae bacterium]|nr:cytochrome c [Steroidobacteraceae bacterium]